MFMALHANATDVKKIHAGIASILARTKEKGKHLALVRTKLFHDSLGLNLPFARFESELSDAVRSQPIQTLYGQWVNGYGCTLGT
jgi:Glu-tRNA(Gln) amidotransferase subunit E-like FAD-binding protein